MKKEYYVSLNVNFKVQFDTGINITTLTSSLYSHVATFLSVLQTLGTGTEITDVTTAVSEIKRYDEDEIEDD